MQGFFKSKKFKAILCVGFVLIGIMLYSAAQAGPSNVLGYLLTPVQKLSSNISHAAGDFFDTFLNAAKYKKQNETLQSQINDYRRRLVEYERLKQENERLNQIVQLKEQNADFQLETATVIGRDTTDKFASFMIDKGLIHGLSLNDPVITDAGLVGIISEINPAFSRVSTILSPERNIGAYDVSTQDLGILSGDVALAQRELCRMSYLPLESGMQPGDVIATTGVNGLYPKGLVIGTVKTIRTESHGTTLYAEIQPAVEVKKINHVFVITDFFGQGYSLEGQSSNE